MAKTKPTKPAAAAKTSKKAKPAAPALTITTDCVLNAQGFGCLPFVVCNRKDMSVARADVSKLKARLFDSGYETDEVPGKNPQVEGGWAFVAVFSGDDQTDAPFVLLARPANATAAWPFPKGKEGESGPGVQSEVKPPDNVPPEDTSNQVEKPEVTRGPAITARKGFFLPPKARLLLVKTTPHKEHHGKDLVQAISLRLRWETTGESLNLLHPNLQAMLFYRRPSVEAQAELPDLPQVVPNLRVPTAVLPLKMEAEYTGYTFEIEYGIDESTALELYTCHLQKFTCDGKEGGTAVIEWSLHSNKNITPELVGVLCGLEGTTITADLIPPTVTAGEAIDGTVGHPGLVTRDPDNGPDATDLFSEAHGRGADGEAQEPGDEREPAEEGAES